MSCQYCCSRVVKGFVITKPPRQIYKNCTAEPERYVILDGVEGWMSSCGNVLLESSDLVAWRWSWHRKRAFRLCLNSPSSRICGKLEAFDTCTNTRDTQALTSYADGSLDVALSPDQCRERKPGSSGRANLLLLGSTRITSQAHWTGGHLG
jgi:hypothetical protein